MVTHFRFTLSWSGLSRPRYSPPRWRAITWRFRKASRIRPTTSTPQARRRYRSRFDRTLAVTRVSGSGPQPTICGFWLWLRWNVPSRLYRDARGGPYSNESCLVPAISVCDRRFWALAHCGLRLSHRWSYGAAAQRCTHDLRADVPEHHTDVPH